MVDLSRLYRFGDEGGLRRFPILLNVALSAVLGAIFVLIGPHIFPAVRAFNDGALSVADMIILLIVGLPMYLLFFVYLASLKAVLDWVLDAK
ncbi:hypothetical protein KUV51_02350 [Tateyamaria omphalii]|uniref:hypothetical protein n=1 Tax=Tateyamaria omphalii TaxID=299262 RepID=UPI001C9A02FF|nr:hypothetical protein [Tateyamaria omphalii]MBY5931828.1 hypothetical protein [Tateyamaria omphalii]